MQKDKLINFLLDHKRAFVLLAGIIIILILFVIVDLPLAGVFFQKARRTYQMNKKYNSSEILEEEIEKEKSLNASIMEVVSHLQSGKINQKKLTPVMELLDQSARDNKVSLTSVSSSLEIEDEEYIKIPFELELEGEYHNIAKFINQLENNPYPLRIESLDMSTKDYISYNLRANLKANLYLIRQ